MEAGRTPNFPDIWQILDEYPDITDIRRAEYGLCSQEYYIHHPCSGPAVPAVDAVVEPGHADLHLDVHPRLRNPALPRLGNLRVKLKALKNIVASL